MTIRDEIKKLEKQASIPKQPTLPNLNNALSQAHFMNGAIAQAKDILPLVKKLLEVVEMQQRDLEAIAKDNRGDFSKYSCEEFIEHLQNEVWFCEQSLKESKQLLEGENNA